MPESHDAAPAPEAGRCQGVTREGKPCQRFALPGKSFCHHHAPDRKEALREAGRKGGSAPRRPELPDAEAIDPEEGRRILAGLLSGVVSGEVSEGVARSVAYLLQVDVTLRNEALADARRRELADLCPW